jgi:hypothetical protein
LVWVVVADAAVFHAASTISFHVAGFDHKPPLMNCMQIFPV